MISVLRKEFNKYGSDIDNGTNNMNSLHYKFIENKKKKEEIFWSVLILLSSVYERPGMITPVACC